MTCFILLVLVLPVILLFGGAEAQSSQSFVIGTDATLQCSFSRLEDPNLIKKMKWFHRGKRLKNEGRYTLAQVGLNFTLTIKKITKKDKGAYICSPVTVVDMIDVSDGTFNVAVRPPPIPEEQEVREISFVAGSTKSAIRCSFGLKSVYGLSLFWSKDGKKLKDDRMEIERVASYEKNGTDFLQFNDVTMDNKGRFACNYKYPDGRIFSMKFDVEVETPEGPEDVARDITWGPTFVRGALQCDMSSLENITIKEFYWEKDGEKLSSIDKYQISENGPKKFIQIQDLENSDSGIYRCVAQLEYYPVAVAFNVTVDRGNKHLHYSDWTEFSVCSEGFKYRFRVCVHEMCVSYDIPYEVDRVKCKGTLE